MSSLRLHWTGRGAITLVSEQQELCTGAAIAQVASTQDRQINSEVYRQRPCI